MPTWHERARRSRTDSRAVPALLREARETARIIDGKVIAARVRKEVADGVVAYRSEYGRRPGLAAVLVGNDPASASYVRGKEKACGQVGIESRTIHLAASTAHEEVLATVEELNLDASVHGILVQLPLPPQVDADALMLAVDPAKDVDGLHPHNLGLLLSGKPRFVPATPLGIQRIIAEEGVELEGAEVVICGRSTLVGRPLAELLTQRGPGGNATVTVCHTKTRNLRDITVRADILVTAMGSPGAITGEMVKPGAVVIDVGTTRVDDPSRKRGYRLVGDVVFDEVAEVASAITPVPGGVGPLTIAMLLHNVLLAANLTRFASRDQ